MQKAAYEGWRPSRDVSSSLTFEKVCAAMLQHSFYIAHICEKCVKYFKKCAEISII